MTGATVLRLNSRPLSARDLAVEMFEQLRIKTFDGVGITRECYGDGENVAFDLYRKVAESHGLVCQPDAAANLIISLPNDDGAQPALIVGSHTDSVPQGGNYDGAAGIIAGLLCLLRLHSENILLPFPVRVIVLRAEESAFYGRANIGSRTIFGGLSANDLAAKSRGTGRTLREAMVSAGVDIDRVERGERIFDPAQAREYLELHIEQGPIMVARRLPTSVVTGIRGNLRHRKVVCRGEAGHSGAVPRWLRRDAMFAVSDLLMRLDEHWNHLLERGLDLVITAGIVSTNPSEHAISRIPGELQFSFEVRSQSYDTLEAFYELFRSECRAIGKERHVIFEFDERVYTEPAKMDEGIVKRLLRASEKLALPTEAMASGAGHDAAVFANAGIPSGMIFVRNANGSHNPNEEMDIDDFMLGVELMFGFLTASN